MDAQSVRAWTIECRGSAGPVVRDMTWYSNASANTAARSVRVKWDSKMLPRSAS